MRIVRDLGEKGQVVIPKDIRKILGVERNDKIVFEVHGDEIVIKSDNAKNFLEDFLNVPKVIRGKGSIKDMIFEQYG